MFRLNGGTDDCDMLFIQPGEIYKKNMLKREIRFFTYMPLVYDNACKSRLYKILAGFEHFCGATVIYAVH